MNPRAWLAVLGLSVVGIAISLGAYGAGRRGKSAVRERFSTISDERWEQVQGWYDRWGSGILLMSALPGLATVLTVGAGMFDIRFVPFLFWVSISKVMRNWLIVLLLYGGYKRFIASPDEHTPPRLRACWRPVSSKPLCRTTVADLRAGSIGRARRISVSVKE